MLYLLLVAYALLLGWLAWRNFRLALFIFVGSLPSYLIRFQLGPLPTTLLELEFGVLFVIWLIKFARADWPLIKQAALANKFFSAALLLFSLASVSGIFVSDMWWYSLGQWRAYFLEPILFFIILLGRRDWFTARDVILALLLSTASISAVALIQVTTGAPYPPSLWNDTVAGRATGFFTSPNAVGLYLGPIILLGLGLWLKLHGQSHPASRLALGLVLLSALGLLAAQSLGGLIAVGASAWLFLLLIYKKPALVALGLALLLVLTPPTRQLLAHKSKSLQNRLTLWSHTGAFLLASPKNFVFGTGIRQYFRKIEKPLYNPRALERLIYPHNIFLNFWTEIGLLGLISFITIFTCLLLAAYGLLPANRFVGAGLVAALAALFLHGLIDVPYFKNDLAFLFWIMAAAVLGHTNLKLKTPTTYDRG